MSELIKTKLRNQEKIEITIPKKNPNLLEQAFGSAKGAKFKFERDRRERVLTKDMPK